MRRKRDEFEERQVEELFAELQAAPAPPDDELRAIARSAAARERSHQSPRLHQRLTVRWAAASAVAALVVGSLFGFGLGSALTRPALIPAGEFAAFVTAEDARAAPAAVSTRSCAPAGPFFNVHVFGKREGSFWAQPHIHPEVFAGIPPGTAAVSVWTFGSQTGGPALYGWIADGRSRFSSRCRSRTARVPSRGDLRPAVRVRDGWATGGRFECSHRGRFVIQTEELGRRTRMSVWIERTGELIAMAEAGPGTAWLRIAKRCIERQL
jgi:hypothetical protein